MSEILSIVTKKKNRIIKLGPILGGGGGNVPSIPVKGARPPELTAITHINERRALFDRLQLYSYFFAQQKLLQVTHNYFNFFLFL